MVTAGQQDMLYMPILKARQGEQFALRNVPALHMTHILPVVELLPLPTKSIKSATELKRLYLEKTATWMTKARFTTHRIAIDTAAYFDPTQSARDTLISVRHYLAQRSIQAIPVIYPSMVLINPQTIAEQEFPAIVLRLSTGYYAPDDVAKLVATAKALLPKGAELHLLLDAHAVYGKDGASVTTDATRFVAAAAKARGVTTITFAGGSFPPNLGGIQQGVQNYIERVEWKTWKALIAEFTTLRFGDYAVTHPQLLGDIDPGKMNVSAQIRYARHDDWWLLKAKGVRTKGSGGMGQYNLLCQLLVRSKDYADKDFSYGDANYLSHTVTGASTGSFMTWRRDATSHHLARTVFDLASHFGVAIEP
jgi:hypothetical protein